MNNSREKPRQNEPQNGVEHIIIINEWNAYHLEDGTMTGATHVNYDTRRSK